jgi:hypothetical protein
LAIAASFRQGRPASFIDAACRISWRAASICIAISARRNCTAWCSKIGFAEALALLRIGQRRLERGARHADRLRGDADAAALQAGQGDLVAHAFFADQVLGRDAAVLEHDLRRVRRMLAHLVFDAGDDVAGRIGRHPEGADALLAGGFVGDGHDDRDVAVSCRW